MFAFQVRSDAKVADAREQAPAAAERAAKALFSYDYRHLPADRERAANYVTDSFGKEYLKNFTQLEKQKDGSPGLAVQSKTVVTADVVGSGVVDAEDGRGAGPGLRQPDLPEVGRPSRRSSRTGSR